MASAIGSSGSTRLSAPLSPSAVPCRSSDEACFQPQSKPHRRAGETRVHALDSELPRSQELILSSCRLCTFAMRGCLATRALIVAPVFMYVNPRRTMCQTKIEVSRSVPLLTKIEMAPFCVLCLFLLVHVVQRDSKTGERPGSRSIPTDGQSIPANGQY